MRSLLRWPGRLLQLIVFAIVMTLAHIVAAIRKIHRYMRGPQEEVETILFFVNLCGFFVKPTQAQWGKILRLAGRSLALALRYPGKKIVMVFPEKLDETHTAYAMNALRLSKVDITFVYPDHLEEPEHLAIAMLDHLDRIRAAVGNRSCAVDAVIEHPSVGHIAKALGYPMARTNGWLVRKGLVTLLNNKVFFACLAWALRIPTTNPRFPKGSKAIARAVRRVLDDGHKTARLRATGAGGLMHQDFRMSEACAPFLAHPDTDPVWREERVLAEPLLGEFKKHPGSFCEIGPGGPGEIHHIDRVVHDNSESGGAYGPSKIKGGIAAKLDTYMRRLALVLYALGYQGTFDLDSAYKSGSVHMDRVKICCFEINTRYLATSIGFLIWQLLAKEQDEYRTNDCLTFERKFTFEQFLGFLDTESWDSMATGLTRGRYRELVFVSTNPSDGKMSLTILARNRDRIRQIERRIARWLSVNERARATPARSRHNDSSFPLSA